MRIVADEPRKRMALQSPHAWLRRPFTPDWELTFEHERLQVRQGRWSATFRFLDVKYFELRRERRLGPAGKPSHDGVSLWVHLHLPDAPERRIHEGRLELFRAVHSPRWSTRTQAARYERMCQALEELGFEVHAVTLCGKRQRPPERKWREQGWHLAADTLQQVARLSGELFLVTALFFGTLFFGWWLLWGRS